MEAKHGVVKVGERCGLKHLSPKLGSIHLMELHPAVHSLTKELPLSHELVCMNQFYIDGTSYRDGETVDFNECTTQAGHYRAKGCIL